MSERFTLERVGSTDLIEAELLDALAQVLHGLDERVTVALHLQDAHEVQIVVRSLAL